MMTSFLFYLLSFTWGLPVTLAGGLCAIAALICGAKREKAGRCLLFRRGKSWGGFSLGVFLFVCEDADGSVLLHEEGHSVQNCIYGPLMPFIVSIPSAVRYWRRRLGKKKPRRPYGSAWFEAQATRFGERLRRGREENKRA